MEWLVIVGTCLCVGSAVLCLLVAGRVRQMADEAEMAAEDADKDAQTCLGVSGSVTAFAEGEVSMVSELRKEMQELAAKYAEMLGGVKASAADADASRQAAESWFNVAREQADTTVSMAELVKVEVAKLTTMIDQLNKVRQDNPPFVSITYGETGEPEKAGLNTFTPDGVSLSSLEWWPDHTPAGTPFQFAPAQAKTVVIDDNEADLSTSEVTK